MHELLISMTDRTVSAASIQLVNNKTGDVWDVTNGVLGRPAWADSYQAMTKHYLGNGFELEIPASLPNGEYIANIYFTATPPAGANVDLPWEFYKSGADVFPLSSVRMVGDERSIMGKSVR